MVKLLPGLRASDSLKVILPGISWEEWSVQYRSLMRGQLTDVKQMNLPMSGQQLPLGTPHSAGVVKAAVTNLRNGSTNEVNLQDENMNK